MRLILVSGSGTASGKTITTAAMAACARVEGLRVAVVKPVQTGVGSDEPHDVDVVTALSGVRDVHELATFDEPLAPGTAARLLGVDGPSLDELVDGVLGLSDRDLVIIEGAGGALVHLNADGATLLELGVRIRSRLHADDVMTLVLTAASGLGTLHSTAATAMAVRASGLEVDHLVISDWPTVEPDLAQRSNLEDLPRYSGAPLSGVLTTGMGSLDQVQFALKSHAGLAPALGGAFNTAEFAKLASCP